MGVAERRNREKIALRQEILDAARELFAKEGYESVSMRKIAEKIEYSPTTIYLYFQDKEALIHEICEQTFTRLSSQIEKEMAVGGDPVKMLKQGLHTYIQFGLENPDHYRVTFLMKFESRVKKDMENSAGGRTFGCLVDAVTRCVKAGKFRNADVMAVSQSIWSCIHGFVALQITHGECFPWIDRDELQHLVVDNTVRGFLKK